MAQVRDPRAGRCVARLEPLLLRGRGHDDVLRPAGANRPDGANGMAEPLARSDTIRVLEEAVDLVRQASPRVLLIHWVGSVPFALALLWSWSSITSAHTTDAAWAGQAFV